MKYNIQFDDSDVLTIQDQERPAPISPGDDIMIRSRLYKVEAVIHNLDDGKTWVIVR